MTNTQTKYNQNDATIHTFEAAGLGKAPFRLNHVTSEGGFCQFCGTMIVFRFYIDGTDSRQFYVGSDCVMKTGDNGLMRVVEREVKLRQAALKKTRDEERLVELRSHLAVPAVTESLSKQPHPYAWHARQGKTMKDYAEWIMRHGGNTAKMKLAGSLLPKKVRAKKNTQATA